MDKNKRKWLLAILTVGLIVVFELIHIYIKVNILGSEDASFCHISELIDCDGVSGTKYAQTFGVPLCVWGLCLYLFILFLTFVDKLQNLKFLGFLKVFKNPLSYIYSLALLSFSLSLILAGVQIWAIQKICVLCFATYLIDFSLVLAAKTPNEKLWYDIKVSVVDFLEAIKVKKYAIAFALVVLAGICVLVYTSYSCVLTPQVKMQREFDKVKMLKSSDFKVSGNELGDYNATVTVVEFSDFQCPFCALSNTLIRKVMLDGNVKNVRVIHKNFPLDRKCNKFLPATMHPQACMLARYAIAAEKQNKMWDMTTILFDQKPTDEETILKLAEDIGLDTDKLKEDAHSKEVKRQLRHEIREGVHSGIKGTPAIVVNGEPYTGIKLEYQLEEIFLKHGATK